MPIDPRSNPSIKPESTQPVVPPSGTDQDKFRSAYSQEEPKVDEREAKSGGQEQTENTESKSKETDKQVNDRKQDDNKKTSDGPFSAAGKVTQKKDKKDDTAAVNSMVQSLQDALLKTMGGGAAVAPTEGKGVDASRAEAAQLVTQMVDRLLINDPQFSGKSGARLVLGGEVNPNLKGVEVVINTLKTDGGTQLSIQFMANTPDAANYIRHNMEALDTRLKQDLTSFNDIRVDIRSQGEETGREGRSKGQYIAPEEEQK